MNDFFKTDSITLYHGDCLEVMKQIPDKSCDACICDLPYGTTSCAWDAVIPFEPLWEHYKRIIKPNGNIVLFASGKFVFSLYNSQPNLYRYDLIWQKSKCGSPLTAKYMPMKMHEHILVFGNSGAIYNPQMSVGGKPYKKDYNHAYGVKNNHKYGIKGVHTENYGERQPISVLRFDQKWRRQDQNHPAEKPVDLLRYLIRTYSNEGDTILDNTMGSGSTGVAAVMENRKFIGIELQENYHQIAVKRINEAIIKKSSEIQFEL
jgi:site-specific DNA-methyltransferase (adenine-specific)